MKTFLSVVLYMIGFCLLSINGGKCKKEYNGASPIKDSSHAVECNKTYCYCVWEDGTRIGNYHAPIASKADMDCKCAWDKMAYRKRKLIGITFRCNEKGGYESIQCLGSICYCVDKDGKRKAGLQVPIYQRDTLLCPETL